MTYYLGLYSAFAPVIWGLPVNCWETRNMGDYMRENTLVYSFRFTLKHDDGYVRIITSGTSPQEARRKVILAENCPLSAITKEEIWDGRKFARFM
jgi:hypothetical protein